VAEWLFLGVLGALVLLGARALFSRRPRQPRVRGATGSARELLDAVRDAAGGSPGGVVNAVGLGVGAFVNASDLDPRPMWDPSVPLDGESEERYEAWVDAALKEFPDGVYRRQLAAGSVEHVWKTRAVLQGRLREAKDGSALDDVFR
jgi:hypothetical protein